MVIEEYKAEDVPKDLLEVLKRLTLPSGLMWGAFLSARRVNSDKIGRVFVCRDDDGVVVGWVLRWMFKGYHSWHCYVFVDSKYRRKGVGSMLVEKSLKRVSKKRIVGHAWDSYSKIFWDSFASPKLKVANEYF